MNRESSIATEGRKRSSINCCAEPFRLFFPIGALMGMLGVSLWPLFYAGILTTYPAILHARLMIEGFMASFIIGFLGTAGPRITSTPHFSRGELTALFTLDLFAAGLHFGGSHRAGDGVFVCCLAVFVLVIGKRFVRRKDSPPPNFALVALGLLNGLVGALLLTVFEDKMYSTEYRLGALLLEQGLVLLPILGIAPFFLSRLLDLPSTGELPGSRVLPPGWFAQAAFAASIGLIIDLTFVAESIGITTISGWVRFATIVVYLIARMPWHGRTFLGDCLRAGVTAVVVGIAVETLWPQYRIGALHIVFVTGFGFVALTVAIRVVFGHSGNAHLFQGRLPFFVVAGALLLLAMLTRYVADLVPRGRTVHLVGAALFWLVAVLIWTWNVIPKVAIPDPEE